MEEPAVPRQRRAPKKFETKESAHEFQNSESYYRKIFFEVYNTVLSSMNSRFKSETIDLLKLFENFVIGQKDSWVDDIIAF